MGLTAGQEYDPYAGETDKERRKREKEEEKRRKKEAEEEKKRKKGRKGKDDLDTSEDRLDNMVRRLFPILVNGNFLVNTC